MAKPSRVIAIEEHFSTPGFKTVGTAMFPSDLGEKRLADMDRAGIDLQVISLSSPGVQGEADAATAIDKARRANDMLADAIRRHPARRAKIGS